MNSLWTNGRIERFSGLSSRESDCQIFHTLDAAAVRLTQFATYCTSDQQHGELDWNTPAERYGTPFSARGFEHVPALDHLHGLLAE